MSKKALRRMSLNGKIQATLVGTAVVEKTANLIEEALFNEESKHYTRNLRHLFTILRL
ncbi:hypothetical protein AXF42_Ash018240 [Apostasia shenzhenica]|uniref:Uncharacterized protein n=1 Tax=Apostasia shenzhenica TaxID=1088818 RepID=A0A2I0B2J3_9ASPA|nr:hypothetical protein AXF42_Ash018240 [Apostasia shenzhenica]